MLRLALVFISIFLILPGCGDSGQVGATPLAVSQGGISFDAGVPAGQRAQLAKAIQSVQGNHLAYPEPEFLRISGLTDSSPQSLLSWLEARVQYILPENADIQARVKTISPQYYFQNAGVIPEGSGTGISFDANYKGNLLMKNVGASYYYAAKKAGVLATMQVDGVGAVPLTSPRVGILQVGEELFSFLKSGEPALNNAYLTVVLFHEARHSDGNGRSMGFLHSNCPSGDLVGIPACDASRNGSYSLSANMIKSYLLSCLECSPTYKQTLKILYLDSASRVMEGATDWDDTPEGNR